MEDVKEQQARDKENMMQPQIEIELTNTITDLRNN